MESASNDGTIAGGVGGGGPKGILATNEDMEESKNGIRMVQKQDG
jgi:hypothetical protein